MTTTITPMAAVLLAAAARNAERERIAALAEHLNAVWGDLDEDEWRDFSWRIRHPKDFGD